MEKEVFRFPLESGVARRVWEKEREKRGEKLEQIIEKISNELKKEGIPVNKHCRIEMSAFSKIFPPEKLEKDEAFVKKQEKRWFGNLSKEEIEKKKLQSDGERLERLKTAIFYKFLKSDFIVARSSYYDDYKNHVDNLIIDRKTGEGICALDEVADISGKNIQEKRDQVLERNFKSIKEEGGAEIDYGCFIKESKILLGGLKNLPVFYLCLPKEKIEKGIEGLESSLEEFSEMEKTLFQFFISSIKQQIERLNKFYSFCISPSLQERINSFNEKIPTI
jgi:hypothetical protein